MTDLRTAVFTVLEGWTLPRYARQILETAYYAQPEQGEVVVTKNPQGQIVAVTRQDEDHHVLKVIATSNKPERDAVDWDALIEDIEAINCRYRGDPSYDYCPYDIRDRAAKIVRERSEYYTSLSRQELSKHEQESVSIGMRDTKYKDSTPLLHVGNSAFEDWFQAQPFATQSGIKQISRDSYAAGMGDPCVTYTAQPEQALDKKADNARSLGLNYEPDQNIDGDTSDGYHTFNELYDFRKAYNAALFNEWAASGKYSVHKSKRHYDGEECFGGGWFIVVAQLPNGQISNHYEMKDWELFQLLETEKALFEYDNHTSVDVLKRLYSLTMNEKNHD